MKSLQLGGDDNIDDTGVIHLTDGFRQERWIYLPLTQLGFSSCSITDVGLMALLSVIEGGHLPALEQLDVRFAYISDAGTSALSKVIQDGHLSKLTRLDLGGNDIGQKGERLLAAAVSEYCPKLDLSFSD